MSVSNSHFCLLPPGKPDPYHTPQGNEPRKRIKYQGLKGYDTCSYYALKLLRNSAAPKAEQSQLREDEKAISNHRKQMTQLTLAYEPVQKFLKNLPKDIKLNFLECAIKNISTKTASDHDKEKIQYYYNAFANQKEITNFHDFIPVQWNKDCIKIHTTFFLSKLVKVNKFPIDPRGENALLQNHVFLKSKNLYGCKDASWEPNQGVDALIKELSEKGPHLVNAALGQCFYKEDAKKLSKTLGGRNVYGWPEGSPRTETKIWKIWHYVVIVGAEKDRNGNSYIYFIDPVDPSDPDPDKPITQKIYKTSYKRLLLELNNIVGVPLADKKIAPNYPFALHM